MAVKAETCRNTRAAIGGCMLVMFSGMLPWNMFLNTHTKHWRDHMCDSGVNKTTHTPTCIQRLFYLSKHMTLLIMQYWWVQTQTRFIWCFLYYTVSNLYFSAFWALRRKGLQFVFVVVCRGFSINTNTTRHDLYK